jgi:hypothetical protein
MDAEAEVRIRGSSKGNLRVSDGAVFQRLAAGVMSYRLRLRMLSGMVAIDVVMFRDPGVRGKRPYETNELR